MPGSTLPRGNVLVVKVFGISITPSSVSGAITAEQSFTVQGLQVGDYVNVNANAAQTNGVFVANARVSAANTLTLAFGNVTAGALTPVAGAYTVSLARSENSPLPTDAT